MAVNLSKNYQQIFVFHTNEQGYNGDRCWHIYAKYDTTNNPTQARIYIKSVFESGDRIWGGSASISVNDGAASASFGYGNGTVNEVSYLVNYNSTTGQYRNQTLKVAFTSSKATWGNSESFDGQVYDSPQSTTVNLPDVDPAPTVTINSVSILSGGLSGNAVASVSKLRVNITYKNTRTMLIKWVGSGIDSGNKIINVSYSASDQTLNYDMDVNVPPSSSDYALRFTVTYGNNTLSNQTKTYDYTIRGYWLPTYDNGTYTQRCDVNGNADAQGEYGRLYLKWKFASINGANAMSSISVKLNGTTLVNGQNCVITGSISAGYLNYIFPLALNTQGDLSIIMTDLITTVTIDNLAVPKSIMALSLYQNNTDVGVTIGRMATQAGFYEALDFYLKGKDHGTFYELSIDTNGVLYVNGNPVAYTSGGSV